MLEIAVQLTASHQLPLGERELVAALADSNLMTVPCFQPHWRTLMPFVLDAVNGALDNACAGASASADCGIHDPVYGLHSAAVGLTNGIGDGDAGDGGNCKDGDRRSRDGMTQIRARLRVDAMSSAQLKTSLQQRVWLPHIVQAMNEEVLYLRKSSS
jgi:hypothetical protein